MLKRYVAIKFEILGFKVLRNTQYSLELNFFITCQHSFVNFSAINTELFY